MNEFDRMTCETVDELGAAYLLGAVEPGEAAAIVAHLATCDRPHPEVRDGVGAELLSAGLEPVAPPAALRDRLMATIERTPQDHRTPAPVTTPAAARSPERARSGRFFDWLSGGWARGVLATAAAAVIALAAWNIGLQGQLRDSRAVADAIANARAVHTVTSDAGRGLLLDTGSGSAFVPAEMAAPSGNRVYEAWLIPAEGAPVGIAVFRPSDGPMLIQLDRPLSDFSVFALTVEDGFVTAPTSAPVMTFALSS